MSLNDRIYAELARLGSVSHPIARTLPYLIREAERCTRRILALSVTLAFLAGFLACYAWQGAKLEVLATNVEAWRAMADTEYRTHHNPVKVGKAQAQVITQQREDAKRGGE